MEGRDLRHPPICKVASYGLANSALKLREAVSLGSNSTTVRVVPGSGKRPSLVVSLNRKNQFHSHLFM